MRIYQDRKTFKTIVELSDDDKRDFKVIKDELTNSLNDYCLYEREELDLVLASHIRNTAKVNELQYIKFDIIRNLNYNDFYKDVINLNTNGFWEFVEGTLFYEFASSFNLLDDTSKAYSILQNIARVKLIDRMIEIDYQDNVVNNKKYKDIFEVRGFGLFKYLNKMYKIDEKHMQKYGVIYEFMKKDILEKDYKVKTSQKKFLAFLKEYGYTLVGQLYPSNKTENVDTKELTELYRSYRRD